MAGEAKEARGAGTMYPWLTIAADDDELVPVVRADGLASIPPNPPLGLPTRSLDPR